MRALITTQLTPEDLNELDALRRCSSSAAARETLAQLVSALRQGESIYVGSPADAK